MTTVQMNKIWWKNIHNVFGLGSSLFLLLLLVTGILLNHPNSLKKDAIETMAVHPSNENIIFLGKKDGVYLSQDQGKSWEEIHMLFPPQEVTDITFSHAHPQEIYLLERWGKIYKSNDGGKVWSSLSLPFDPQSEGIELKNISIGPNEALTVLTSHGWVRSINSGKNWDESHLKKGTPPPYRLILTLHNGYFFSPAFVWVYDFAALALFILIVSGLYLWKIGRKAG